MNTSPDVHRRRSNLGRLGTWIFANILALAMTCTGAVAADLRTFGRSDPLHDAVRFTPVEVEPPVLVARPPILTARRSILALFGRDCLPGFAFDEGGVCVRHDDPKLSCASTFARPTPSGGCVVLPPDPAPYGLGAALRLDY